MIGTEELIETRRDSELNQLRQSITRIHQVLTGKPGNLDAINGLEILNREGGAYYGASAPWTPEASASETQSTATQSWAELEPSLIALGEQASKMSNEAQEAARMVEGEVRALYRQPSPEVVSPFAEIPDLLNESRRNLPPRLLKAFDRYSGLHTNSGMFFRRYAEMVSYKNYGGAATAEIKGYMDNAAVDLGKAAEQLLDTLSNEDQHTEERYASLERFLDRASQSLDNVRNSMEQFRMAVSKSLNYRIVESGLNAIEDWVEDVMNENSPHYESYKQRYGELKEIFAETQAELKKRWPHYSMIAEQLTLIEDNYRAIRNEQDLPKSPPLM